MSFIFILQTVFTTLMKLLDALLMNNQIHTAEDQAAAQDTVQDTLDDVAASNTVPELIDNINKLKRKKSKKTHK